MEVSKVCFLVSVCYSDFLKALTWQCGRAGRLNMWLWRRDILSLFLLRIYFLLE